MTDDGTTPRPGFLDGIRVLELADELGEYCGKVLAGPRRRRRQDRTTRRRGDSADRAVLSGRPPTRTAACTSGTTTSASAASSSISTPGHGQGAVSSRSPTTADVMIDSRPRGYLADARPRATRRSERSIPRLIYARISPFGDTGPWADFRGSDLVHLALGGVMMNCGYDPDPTGHYDTPPMAPQMWQAYHIAGEITRRSPWSARSAHRLETGHGSAAVPVRPRGGQRRIPRPTSPTGSTSVDAHYRQTCRHSMPIDAALPALSRPKDGRWVLPYRTYLPGLGDPFEGTVRLLRRSEWKWTWTKAGTATELAGPRRSACTSASVTDALVERLHVRPRHLARGAGRGACRGRRAAALRRISARIRTGAQRETFFEVEHPELGKSVHVHRAPNGCDARDALAARATRAPVGEHTEEVLAETRRVGRRPWSRRRGVDHGRRRSASAASRSPFPESGSIDLTGCWPAPAPGASWRRMGAEVIKVEHKSRLDGDALRCRVLPARRARPNATRRRVRSSAAPSPSVNRSGTFMEINAGKRAISLNLKNDRGQGNPRPS